MTFDGETPEACRGDPTLLNRRAWLERWQGRAQSLSAAEQALHLTEEATEGRPLAQRGLAFLTLAWQARWRGSFDKALEFGLLAEPCMPETEFPAERAQIYSILGVVHYSRNRLDLAQGALERGQSLLAGESERELSARIDLLDTKALVLRCLGQSTRAMVTLSSALDLSEGAERARVEHSLARMLVEEDEPSAAEERATQAVQLCERFGNAVVLPYALEVLGTAAMRADNLAAARAAYAEALRLAEDDDDLRAQCQVLHRMGMLSLREDDLTAAMDRFREGTRIAAQLRFAPWQKRFALDMADVHEAAGNLRAALVQHKMAWKIEDARRS